MRAAALLVPLCLLGAASGAQEPPEPAPPGELLGAPDPARPDELVGAPGWVAREEAN